MNKILKTALGTAILIAQAPTHAMQPAAKRALAVGASFAAAATAKYISHARTVANAQKIAAKSTIPFLTIGASRTTLGVVGLCSAIAYGSYHVWRTNALHAQARDFCVKLLEETKNALGSWQTDNGTQAKQCLQAIVRLFLDVYTREGILTHHNKQYLEPYIATISSKIPSDAQYTPEIATYTETTAAITNQETADRLLEYCTTLIGHIRAQ